MERTGGATQLALLESGLASFQAPPTTSGMMYADERHWSGIGGVRVGGRGNHRETCDIQARQGTSASLSSTANHMSRQVSRDHTRDRSGDPSSSNSVRLEAARSQCSAKLRLRQPKARDERDSTQSERKCASQSGAELDDVKLGAFADSTTLRASSLPRGRNGVLYWLNCPGTILNRSPLERRWRDLAS